MAALAIRIMITHSQIALDFKFYIRLPQVTDVFDASLPDHEHDQKNSSSGLVRLVQRRACPRCLTGSHHGRRSPLHWRSLNLGPYLLTAGRCRSSERSIQTSGMSRSQTTLGSARLQTRRTSRTNWAS